MEKALEAQPDTPVAKLAPEQVVRAIVNVLLQREVLVKGYKPIEEVEEENRKRREKDAKAHLEELPPKPCGGDWWDAEIYTDEWTEMDLPNLHRILDPEKLHQDTILWFKEVKADNGRPAFRYCFRSAPALTLDALRRKLMRHLAYAYEVQQPAIGNQLVHLRKRVTDMEKVVFYGAQHVLDLMEYEEQEEREEAERKEKEEKSAEEKKVTGEVASSEEQVKQQPPPRPTHLQVLANLVRLQEGRIRELEAERLQAVQHAKNVSESLATINTSVQLLRAKVEGVKPEDAEKKTEEELEELDERDEARQEEAKQRARHPGARKVDQQREAEEKKAAARRRVQKVLAERKKKEEQDKKKKA